MFYTLCGPVRALFRTSLPLTLYPNDVECGVADPKTAEELGPAYKGKHVLCVGGTKGIGKATSDVIVQRVGS
jgi:hypothetical protein